jgi:hypothetical protein
MRLVLFLLGVFTLACASPTSGDYVFETTDYETDCPTADDTGSTGEPDAVSVKVNDDETEVVIAGGDPCPLDGNTYTCTASYDTDLDPYDAVLTIASESTGTWVSNKKITGSGSFETSCSGADCGSVEDLGYSFCGSSWTFEATLED